MIFGVQSLGRFMGPTKNGMRVQVYGLTSEEKAENQDKLAGQDFYTEDQVKKIIKMMQVKIDWMIEELDEKV